MAIDKLDKPRTIIIRLHDEILTVLNNNSEKVRKMKLSKEDGYTLLFKNVYERCGFNNEGFDRTIGAIDSIKFSHDLIWHYYYNVCYINKEISAGLYKFLPHDTRFLLDLGVINAAYIQYTSIKTFIATAPLSKQEEFGSVKEILVELRNSKLLQLRHKIGSHNSIVENENDFLFTRYFDEEIGMINVYQSSKIYGEDINLVTAIDEFYTILEKILFIILKEDVRRIHRKNKTRWQAILDEINKYKYPPLSKFIEEK